MSYVFGETAAPEYHESRRFSPSKMSLDSVAWGSVLSLSWHTANWDGTSADVGMVPVFGVASCSDFRGKHSTPPLNKGCVVTVDKPGVSTALVSGDAREMIVH